MDSLPEDVKSQLDEMQVRTSPYSSAVGYMLENISLKNC
jgi:hypothetical protein